MNRDDFCNTFNVSCETYNLLDQYASTLLKWQKTINLVAPKTLGDLWIRHFADSAQLVAQMPDRPCRTVDLGSGAGFPGLVIAILRGEKYAHDAGERVVLVESDQRKAAFLREVSRSVGVAVDIENARIELNSPSNSFDSVNVVTARALAPLDKLLGYASPFLTNGACGIFPKGRGVREEIKQAEARWAFDYRLVPSVTDPEGRIVVVTELGAQLKGIDP